LSVEPDVLTEEGPVEEIVDERRFLEHESPHQGTTPPGSWPGERGETFERLRF
jgi:hypothetical protein